jgi:predicted RNA-binding Zn ribbon-like protein
MERQLALELAGTIRHDGHEGVTDALAEVAGLTDWVRERADLFAGWMDVRGFVADEEARSEVTAIRRAVRALFARAVSPASPNPAASDHALLAEEALTRLNTAAGLLPVTPALDWPFDALPTPRWVPAGPTREVRLVAVLAHAAIEFMTGPYRSQLRACSAPRCVRYFVKEHGRQEWCKPSCGNRARAARHYQRHRASAG